MRGKIYSLTAQHSTAQLRSNYVDLTTEYKNIQAYFAG